MKYLYILIAIMGLMLVSVPASHASINPNNFQIYLNDGEGTTINKIVTIKVRHDYSGGSGTWDCLPDKDTSSMAAVEINNTGQRHYQYVGDGQCINGWSNIQWDITGFDGNASYGVKTIYFQLSEQGGGNAWTTRGIVYEKPAPVVTPTLTPVQTPVTAPKTTTPKTTTPTINPVTTPAATTDTATEQVTSTLTEQTKTNVLGDTTESTNPTKNTAYIITIGALGIAIISLIIYVIKGRKKALNKIQEG